MMALIVIAMLLALAAVIVIAVMDRDKPEGPRELLKRELVEGKISTEEFLERESALRDAEPARRRRL